MLDETCLNKKGKREEVEVLNRMEERVLEGGGRKRRNGFNR